ncbi:3'-5' exonuclease [Streptomyces sp. NPDC020875]|uniref:3'-5' exonuclease n=1 Tax=Streptomyces sp. NPDC020875 TaxID=3154898 RepID=UPI0033EB3C12
MTDTTTTTARTGTAGTTAPVPQQERHVPEALGVHRIAALLAGHTEAPVTADDVDTLIEQGHLEPHSTWKRWTLYSTAAALALDKELVTGVARERVAWVEASVTRDEAAARIGWHWRDIARMGEEGRIVKGRLGRYLTADVDRLAAEADGEQYLTAQSAAADVLEIRHPADWKYVEAAGWITPATTYELPVGTSGRRTVTVPLYRLADVRAVRDLPGVDWEAVRGLPKGKVSPLREYAALAPTRAAAVRAFAQALADRHQVTVWARHSPYTGRWEVEWERRDDHEPIRSAVAAALAADPAASAFWEEVDLGGTDWGPITREARQLLEPGAAVVLDTETTDLGGRTVEIAVVDAATGKKLMETLVNPEAPITDGARWVHGITDEMVADARTFDKILPRLKKVTRDRTVCAYNTEFDQSVVVGDTERVGKKPDHLGGASWYCLMKAYASWLGSGPWIRLGGRHRALGDAQAAREVLIEMSKGRGTEFTPRPPAPGDPVSGPPPGTALAADAAAQS